MDFLRIVEIQRCSVNKSSLIGSIVAAILDVPDAVLESAASGLQIVPASKPCEKRCGPSGRVRTGSQSKVPYSNKRRGAYFRNSGAALIQGWRLFKIQLLSHEQAEEGQNNVV